MKKEINSKSRRKWIMGGLAAFASVALLTTGFAIWAVGVTQTEKNQNVEVGVNTAVNSSITFDYELDNTNNTLGLGEKKAFGKEYFVKDDLKAPEGETYVTEDLTIRFNSISVKVGTNIKTEYTKISLSILTKDEADNLTTDQTVKDKYADNKAAKDKNLLGAKREGTEWTYFELKDLELPLEQTNKETETINGFKAYKVADENLIVDFRWGSFFGNTASDETTGKSPCTYYNELFDNKPAEQTAENAQHIVDELTAMHKQLNGKNIVLHMELA